jgi:hypothetical protein
MIFVLRCDIKWHWICSGSFFVFIRDVHSEGGELGVIEGGNSQPRSLQSLMTALPSW